MVANSRRGRAGWSDETRVVIRVGAWWWEAVEAVDLTTMSHTIIRDEEEETVGVEEVGDAGSRIKRW